MRPRNREPVEGGKDTVEKALRRAGRKQYWSARVTHESNALDLEDKVFTRTPKEIAISLKRSADRSARRKSPPFRSAMSMLNFYINRAGRNLSPAERRRLEAAKRELRLLFHRQAG